MFLATSLVLRIPSPRLRRYFIGNSGATCLLFTAGKSLSVKYTPEKDCIYFNDYTDNGVTYGLICIEMKDLYTKRQAKKILVAYINKMRTPFKIAYNVAMDIQRKSNVVLVSDYWQDNQCRDWKIKGYTNGKVMAVLYVKNISLAAVKDHDAFLESFRFGN